jgi:hypothetical protein
MVSCLRPGPASLIGTARKREADGSVLLRAYDAVGRPAEGSLRLVRPPKEAQVASPIGEPGEEIHGPLAVGAFEIATWLLGV